MLERLAWNKKQGSLPLSWRSKKETQEERGTNVKVQRTASVELTSSKLSFRIKNVKGHECKYAT